MTYLRKLDVRIWLIIVSVVAVGWLQSPRLGDDFRVDEDFRAFYWMNKFQDPALFPNHTVGYTLLRLPWGDVPVTFYSLGYGLLFYAASFAIPPILLSKLLPFGLMPLTVWYLFEFGQASHQRRTDIVLALVFLFFNLASSSSISIANGLQRSFAATLIIALLYYLQRQKYLAAALVMVLSALIYAPMCALGLATWAVFILKMNWPLKLSWPRAGGAGYWVGVLGVGLALLLPALLAQVTAVETSPTGAQSSPSTPVAPEPRLWDNPVYQMGGAYPLFIIFPVVGRGGLVDLGEDLINLFILLALSGLIYLVLGRRAFALPVSVWCLWWAIWVMFAVSWASMGLTNSFLLYLPSRYTRVGLFLFLLMLVCLKLTEAVNDAPHLIRHHPRRLLWLAGGLEMLALGLLLGYPDEGAMLNGFNMKWLLGPVAVAGGLLSAAMFKKPARFNPSHPSLTQILLRRVLLGLVVGLFGLGWAIYTPLFTEVSYLNPTPAERAVLKFLEALPKNVMIAGTPCALDNVPLFAKRQVLFDCEQGGEDEVVRAALAAYYTDKPQVIADFCQTYHVDYLVVDQKTYTRSYFDHERLYFEPYNRDLRRQLTGRETFVLAQVPNHLKVFQQDNFFVAPCVNLKGQ
jgi:hypothetical protein